MSSYFTRTKYAATSIPNASAGKVNEFVDTDGVTKAKSETGTIEIYSGTAAVAAHVADPNPHPQYETAAEAQAKVDAHANLTNNPHAVTKTQVGLSNVPNIDATNPSNIIQTATHRFVTDTEKSTWNASQANAESYADGLISSLVGTSPTTLDTLQEIAAALGNNPAAISDILTALGLRLRFDINNQGLSTLEKTNAKTNLGLENVENTADIDKVVSTPTQNALALKADNILTGLSLTNSSDVVATDTVLQGIGKLQAHSDLWTELVTTAVLTNNSNATLTSIPQLQINVVAGKTYRVEGMLLYRSTQATTGMQFTVALGGGAVGTLAFTADIPIAADGATMKYCGNITASGDVVLANSTPAANVDHLAQYAGIFVCTTSGTLVPQFRSETNGQTITVQIGSNQISREF